MAGAAVAERLGDLGELVHTFEHRPPPFHFKFFDISRKL